MLALGRILEAAAAVRERLDALPATAVFGPAREDVARQLGRLVYPGMLAAAGLARLGDVERYLQAAAQRLDRLASNVTADRERMAAIQELQTQAAGRSDVLWLIEEVRVAQLSPGVNVRPGATVKRVREALAKRGPDFKFRKVMFGWRCSMFRRTISRLDLIGAALRGPHRHLGVGAGGPALRYRPDVASFASLGPDPDRVAWNALAALPGDRAALVGEQSVVVPAGWSRLMELPVLLMSGVGVEPSSNDPEIVELGDDDVPEMLDLVARTAPGPFLARTIDCGGYLGIRRDGVLAAMAGRRLHPPGWIEVSAVCTDPAYRGLGFA